LQTKRQIPASNQVESQTVIIENVGGASGGTGTARLARAVPDGYTLGIGNWSTHVVNAAVSVLPYDVLNDFEPVAVASASPLDRKLLREERGGGA
jgi:tripartite-type tricarboxylate transporter receptor subunit TctC